MATTPSVAALNPSVRTIFSTKFNHLKSTFSTKENVADHEIQTSASSASMSSALPVRTPHISSGTHTAPFGYNFPATNGALVSISTSTNTPDTSTGLVTPPSGQSRRSTTESANALPGTNDLHYIFRDPLEIPGTKKKIYVYRYADDRISKAHRDRFPNVVDLFRQKLLTVEALSKSGPASTLYKLKLCGSDKENAIPSILICHPWINRDVGRRIWKSVRDKSLRVQYELTPPFFGVYIFFSQSFWLLGNSSKSFSLHMNNGVAGYNGLVGARLISDNTSQQISTITCGIYFSREKEFFGLTTAHGFDEDTNNANANYNVHDESIERPNSVRSEDMEEEEFSSSDDEYDWNELESAAVEFHSTTWESSSDIPMATTLVSSINPQRVWGRSKNREIADLDWALIELATSAHEISETISTSCPSKAADDVVLVTSSASLTGSLSQIPSYTTTNNSTILHKIWTLNLYNTGIHNKSTCAHSLLIILQVKICARVTVDHLFSVKIAESCLVM